MRVAAAQIETTLGDLAANLRKHRDWIERARAAAVDVLVFPELSLTGYSLRKGARDLALPRDSASIGEIANAAGAMAVILGFVELAESGRLFNTAVTVRDGGIVSVHRKINLPGYGRLEENRWFAAGERIETFSLAPEWTASSLVCADLWNPALVHIAACRGADLLIAPVSSAIEAVDGFDNPRGWTTVLDFYAMMYGLPTVMANRVGHEGDLTFWGGSRVVDACGHTIARSDDREALVIAEISKPDVECARTRLPTVRDSNPALVRAELNRLVESTRASTERLMMP
ncbi:MAG TPA: nitrilase-related carbon-nitrogen hydrolase [Alphaproteobacteria bacterium]|nr:nitrilase-related carbon-nitrogen hydrolase [Alphaproteobacteria bacterium]